MEVRKYNESDLQAIERINNFAAIQIMYHKGISKDSITCVFNDDELVGFSFLILDESVGIKGKQKISISTYLCAQYQESVEIDSMLTDELIKYFHELKRKNLERSMCIRVCCETDEIDNMQFFLEKGFSLSGVIPVLKYDLTQNTKHYDLPKDITIQKLTFTAKTIKAYLDADYEASDDIENEAAVWFKTGDPSYACYVALCDDKIVGAISIWDITDERAATENIFVIPAYRRKNIARELIASAFDELKSRGKKVATLSVSGTNASAMKLYLSCGYSLYYNLLEMTYSCE